MKKIILTLSVMMFSFVATMQVAEAKRFGGGKSFGYSKKMAPKKYNQSKPASQPAAQPGQTGKAGAAGAAGATAAKSGASKWLGPLAGLAAGGLLAAMLFGDGFEGLQIMDLLLFGLIAFLLFAWFKRRQQASQAQYQQAHSHYEAPQQQAPQQSQPQMREAAPQPTYEPSYSGSIIGSGLSDEAEPVSQAPAWFDQAGFIDGAKGHFVSVQQAWDNADVSELQSYCSPELFAAMEAEMAGMQAGDNHTEVEDLEAEMADMAVDGEYFVVSVRFSGFIKEERDGMAHAFNEIWHIRRLAEGEGNWEIAGIQQRDDA